jgi:hypothetical protein
MVGRVSKNQGMFLIEAVAGMLILVSAMITMTVVFHNAANYFNKAERASEATMVARREIVAMRELATDPVQFASGLPAYAANTKTVDSFSVETTVVPHPLDSPSQTLELPFAPNPRRLQNSALLATVRVRWPGSAGVNEPELMTIICEPARTPRSSIDLTFVGTRPNGELEFTARLRDTTDTEIPDVAFEWSVNLGEGFGTFKLDDRLGQRALLTPLNSGSAQVEVTSYYNGQRSSRTRVVNVP